MHIHGIHEHHCTFTDSQIGLLVAARHVPAFCPLIWNFTTDICMHRLLDFGSVEVYFGIILCAGIVPCSSLQKLKHKKQERRPLLTACIVSKETVVSLYE